MDIKSLVRVGVVSSVNPANGTARVAFNALDSVVSYDLPIITRGSKADKDYWIPDIDEQVLCLMQPDYNGRGSCVGYIVGTFYSSVDSPAENNADVRAIKFSDGTVIKHDRATGDLSVNATGNINIKAAGTITINGAKIKLNCGDFMPSATRLGDVDTGHDACGPTALVSASSNVIINGKGAGRVGDSYAPHGCVAHPSHSGTIASGSSSVFINGKPAGRVSDSVSCGGSVAQGSSDVIIGG